ncbi:MAG: ComF family protein [Lentisphaerae bacterium]|nr:ComF family protein [Lentisphaerota bacterium]
MHLTAFMDMLYPRACVGCGEAAGDDFHYLCWNCMAGIQWIRDPYCFLCGDPCYGMIHGQYVCSLCRKALPSFDMARSAASFAGALKTMIHDFKYNGASWLRQDLSSLLAACVRTHWPDSDIDALLWVPLYPTKERERTYNQAMLLAMELAGLLHKPLAGRCLRRIQPTATQTHLTASRRKANVHAAFEVAGGARIAGRRLLLVDDVMTTGATVNECARTLKQAGAAAVYAVTVARG